MVRIEVSEGLYLELPTPLDAAELAALIAANETHLNVFTPHILETSDPEKARQTLVKQTKGLAAGDRVDFKIMVRGTFAGQIMAKKRREKPLTYEIGYWISGEASGKGIVSACTEALSQFCFDRLGAHKLEILCAAENEASARIAEKCGFTREGLLRDFNEIAGVPHDFISYGKVADKPATKES